MSPLLEQLANQVAANTAIEASATELINGIAGRLQGAVDAALANGATATQLEPLSAEIAALNSSSAALSAAILANTPAPATANPAATAISGNADSADNGG